MLSSWTRLVCRDGFSFGLKVSSCFAFSASISKVDFPWYLLPSITCLLSLSPKSVGPLASLRFRFEIEGLNLHPCTCIFSLSFSYSLFFSNVWKTSLYSLSWIGVCYEILPISNSSISESSDSLSPSRSTSKNLFFAKSWECFEIFGRSWSTGEVFLVWDLRLMKLRRFTIKIGNSYISFLQNTLLLSVLERKFFC